MVPSGLRSLGLALALVLPGCGPGTASPGDAGGDASERDAPETDASLADAGSTDAPTDAASGDAGDLDASDLDASALDASALDASALDASALDARDAAHGGDADASLEDADLADDADLDAAGDAGPSDGGILRTAEPPTHPPAVPIAPFTTCDVTLASDAIGGAEHRVPCSPIAYPYAPPSSGPHYSEWAAFSTYTAPVPAGFLVHAMEHGAVVLAYHCESDADCAAVRAEYAALILDRGLDPVCRDEDTPQRIIVVPDPTLPVPIVATAWGHIYSATCLDPTSLRAFVDAHYAMATENFCFPGVDRSATGWCP